MRKAIAKKAEEVAIKLEKDFLIQIKNRISLETMEYMQELGSFPKPVYSNLSHHHPNDVVNLYYTGSEIEFNNAFSNLIVEKGAELKSTQDLGPKR